MNEQFNWYRLGLLIRNDFFSGYRLYVTAFAVLAIAMMINSIPAAGFGYMKEGFYYRWFSGMVIVWGSIHASLMFTELYDKKRNEAWLLLPASALEKTFARYLHGSVFFILNIMVFVTAAALLIEGFNMVVFGRYNGLFNPLNPRVWDAIGVYMVIQPIFFLGGTWFRRARWFKTVMAVFIIGLGLGLLAGVTFLILFAGYFHGGSWTLPGDIHTGDGGLNEHVAMMFDGTVIFLRALCYGIMPPFCLYVAWLRVKEAQVSYGV